MSAALWLALAGMPAFTGTTLPNGIQVLSAATESQTTGFAVFLLGGSCALEPETAGIENLAVECALTGSESHPGERWREMMDSTQATVEGVYSYDYTAVRLQCLAPDLPLLLEALADCLLEPEMDPSSCARVRDALVSSCQASEADPDSRVWNLANSGMFAGHPYLTRPGGTSGTLSGIEPADAAEHLRRRMVSGNILLVHAGPTPPDSLAAMLERSFGRVPEGPRDFSGPPPSGLLRDTLVLERDSIGTSYAVAKFAAPSMDDPDFPLVSGAMDVLSDMLWQELRTERGLTYAAFAGTGASRANWCYLYVSTDSLAQACSLMAGAFREAASGACDPGLVRGSLEVARTRLLISVASPYDLAFAAGRAQIESGDWRNLAAFGDIARELDPGTVGDVLRRWAGPVSWGVVAAGGAALPGPVPLLEDE